MGIYVHVPFCVKKCRYCDFPSIPRQEWSREFLQEYTSALLTEMQSFFSENPDCGKAGTVYLGGGTPSLLGPALVEKILSALLPRISPGQAPEITLEANPGTIDKQMMKEFAGLGINRLSLGVQSLNDSSLQMLGRIHDGAAARDAVMQAMEVFAGVGMDLIYGIPGQSRAQWIEDLTGAARLNPGHVSAYELTPEPGTPLGDEILSGRLSPPPEEEVLEMFFDASKVLGQGGYHRYEISNLSLHGWQCRHNTGYWTGLPYVGFGASAASFLGLWRYVNVRDPVEYVRRVKSGEPLVEFAERISDRRRMGEFLMMGLRMTAGVSARRFFELFREDLFGVFGGEIDGLLAKGHLQKGSDGSIFVPEAFMPLQSEIAMGFLPPG